MILPVIFHNLQGYDSHLLQLAKVEGVLTCIPSTEEKYISFSKKIKVDEYKSRKNGKTISLNYEIRFSDSFKFLQTSLADLVSNLQPPDFKNTKAIFKNNLSLVTKKEFTLMTMFHRYLDYPKDNFRPNLNFIQN